MSLVVEHGKAQVLWHLLSNGATVDMPWFVADEHRGTSLHNAAFWGKTAAVLVLLDFGAKIDARDWERSTALHVAAY